MAPPRSAPVKAAPARSKKTLATADPIFQFGAYSSKAAAESAWRDLARRLPEARSLTPVVERRDAVHRLRASGPAAAALCDRWRAAGGQCFAAG